MSTEKTQTKIPRIAQNLKTAEQSEETTLIEQGISHGFWLCS